MASSSLSTMISICSESVLNFATVRLAEENSEPTSGSDWRNPRRAHDFRDVHILHFEHKVGERFAEFPGILGLHAGKEIVREPGDALHGLRPIRDGQGGISEVYRIGDGCDALLLSRRGDNNRGGRCFHNRLSFIRQYASQYQSGSGTARTPCPSQ